MAQWNNRCGCCFKAMDAPGTCRYCGGDETSSNAPHQLPMGTVLKEQYRIGRVLGQGGFGITYLGWDLYLDIPVAIKEYYPSGMVMRESTVTMEVADVTGGDGARFRNNRDRFMREAKMLARFSQVPEVVQIKNFFLANNTAYIVMEYVEGITLKEYVRDSGGKLTVEKTLSLLAPMIQTLSKVHKTGLVHRDISPDNIMLLADGTAKLLDFGAVRSVAGAAVDKELTKSTEAILKQGYAPIEQYQKKGALGPWTDVYALCATIYYCLTGEVPPDAPARVLAYEEMDMDATGMNESQKAALLHGMALRVEDRIHSMEELYGELVEGIAPDPVPEPVTVSVPQPVQEPKPVSKVETKPESIPEPKPTPKPRPGKKGLLAAVAALCVVAVAVLVIVMAGGKKAELPAEPTELVQMAEREILHSAPIPESTLEWTLYADGELVISGNGEIPDDCGAWDAWKDRILTVTLAGEITRIGNSAFSDCEKLLEVDFGSHLQEIAAGAFRDSGLISLKLPQSLTYIGDAAFRGIGLREVVLPDSLEFLGNWVFADCTRLISVTIGPNTRLCYDEINNVCADPIFCGENGDISAVTLQGYSGGIVEDYAEIYGYRFVSVGKTEYELRGAISHEYADIIWSFDLETGFLQFDGTGWLDTYGGTFQHGGSFARANDNVIPWESVREQVRTVSIADGITNAINPNTFENHINLDDVYIGKGITNIGEYAFANTGIDWLHLPDGIGLSRYAFDHCRNLRYAVTPLDLLILPDGVFNQCLNLEELYTSSCIGDSGSLKTHPFINPAKGETEMPENLTIYTAGRYNHPQEAAEELGIPVEQGIDGRRGALMGICGSTNSANTVYWMLEDNTLRIFGTGGTSFYLNNASAQSYWGDGVRYGFDMGETEFYAYRNEIEHIIVEKGVTHLNANIFKDMTNLKSIDFGSVTHIAGNAVVNCGVEKIIFPETTHTIMKNAIVDCPNLLQVEIYNAEEHLGDSICQSCGKLEKLIFYGYAKPGPYFMRGMEGARILARAQSPMAEFALKNGIPFGSDTVVAG